MTSLPQRQLGPWSVSAVGLGCMPLSFPEHIGNRERSIAVIHRALDLGITLLDTANIYAPAWNAVGHNEALVGEALRSYAGSLEGVVVATKGGITRGDGEIWGRDASREGLLRAAEASLYALGVDRMDVYQLHRPDPGRTFLEQVRNLGAVKAAGLATTLGLSNVTLPELELALEELGGPEDGGVVSVQNEWSPRYRVDRDVLDRCTQDGIAFLPWSPLGGSEQAHEVGSRYTVFTEVGQAHGATAQETVLAWLLATTPVMIPIPGASKPQTVDSIVRSVGVALSPEDLALLDASEAEHSSMYPESEPHPPLR